MYEPGLVRASASIDEKQQKHETQSIKICLYCTMLEFARVP